MAFKEALDEALCCWLVPVALAINRQATLEARARQASNILPCRRNKVELVLCVEVGIEGIAVDRRTTGVADQEAISRVVAPRCGKPEIVASWQGYCHRSYL